MFAGGPVRPDGPADAVILGGSLTGQVLTDASLGRNLVIHGDVNSTAGGAAVGIGADLTAQIQVYGSLLDDPNYDYEIQIGGLMPFPGAFTVDFSGYDGNHEWAPLAAVFVQHADPSDPESPSATYHENTPGARCYRTTPCIGDMNGDGGVGFADINPFVAAQNGVAQYEALKPGLQGSMVYHGDINGDGTVGFADINPFVALVVAGQCGGTGGGRAMMMGEGGETIPDQLPPEELAAVLAGNVSPELYAGLLNMVLTATDSAPDEETQAYWQAVYTALTQ
jgi:hypothetical protein